MLGQDEYHNVCLDVLRQFMIFITTEVELCTISKPNPNWFVLQNKPNFPSIWDTARKTRPLPLFLCTCNPPTPSPTQTWPVYVPCIALNCRGEMCSKPRGGMSQYFEGLASKWWKDYTHAHHTTQADKSRYIYS